MVQVLYDCDSREGRKQRSTVTSKKRRRHTPDQNIRKLAEATSNWGRDRAVVLVEALVKEGNEPSPIKNVDIQLMLTNAGGRIRSETEWRSLLNSAGFNPPTIVTTEASPMSSELSPPPRPADPCWTGPAPEASSFGMLDIKVTERRSGSPGQSARTAHTSSSPACDQAGDAHVSDGAARCCAPLPRDPAAGES